MLHFESCHLEEEPDNVCYLCFLWHKHCCLNSQESFSLEGCSNIQLWMLRELLLETLPSVYVYSLHNTLYILHLYITNLTSIKQVNKLKIEKIIFFENIYRVRKECFRNVRLKSAFYTITKKLLCNTVKLSKCHEFWIPFYFCIEPSKQIIKITPMR